MLDLLARVARHLAAEAEARPSAMANHRLAQCLRTAESVRAYGLDDLEVIRCRAWQREVAKMSGNEGNGTAH